jgi:hypothetical protein
MLIAPEHHSEDGHADEVEQQCCERSGHDAAVAACMD